MEDKVFTPETETETVIQTCSVPPEMTGSDASVSDFVEQEESSIMDSEEIESTKWTNEKHSLYLKSIEASFIDQLYNSLDMRSCQTQNTCNSDATSTWKNYPNECIPSGQFKVLRRGFWSKKRFKRQNSHMKDADRPHVSSGNHWIRHFRNGSLKRLGSTATPLQYPVPDSRLDQEAGCSDNTHQHVFVEEVMDQNFVENISSSRKRQRTANIDHASNDQVVPHYTSTATETPNSFVSPKQ